MKNLATIQKVLNVESIQDADKIEKITVLGWQVVTKKGEFKVGDLATYVSIDTVMPEKPEYEFLSKQKYRIKSIRLRGQLSQGLLLPVPSGNYKEGDDVTDIIGVKKYEKPDNNPIVDKPRMPKVWYKKWIYLFKFNVLYKAFPFLRKKERSPFPTHLLSKTDENRIQSMPQLLEICKGKEFYVNYKLDGSSLSIIHNKVLGRSKFRVCSRNFELHSKNNDWYKVFIETNFKDEILKLVNTFNTNDIMVQGEAIGKFNGNHHNLQGNQIRLFNIFVNGEKLNQASFMNTVLALNIPHCPLYKKVTLNHTMEEILKMSEIKDVLNPNVEVEGLVWRSIDGMTSFKVINNNYLMKYE